MRMQTIAATALIAGALLASPAATPAQAQSVDFPYCTNGGWATDHTCSFYTLEQCMAFINGVGGSCVPNPRATRYPQPAPGPARARR